MMLEYIIVCVSGIVFGGVFTFIAMSLFNKYSYDEGYSVGYSVGYQNGTDDEKEHWMKSLDIMKNTYVE
jgi:hypothetical protein